MIGSLLFPTKEERRIADPNKPSKFRMKVAFSMTSLSLALMSIAWVKLSLDKAPEKETQMYFMVMVFLLTMLFNINKSIIWTVWDSELLEEAPKEQATIENKEETGGAKSGKAGGTGAKKRAPKM